ncbi:hypothetical protein CKO42_01320 [Lamprobacter modestohalophilus]|uniref:Ni,Fe-hydrogenase I large subunit n=1 Tax=Lamprobacter modestohalophilus TaxID=1064514 RepID=A0A9X0W580_9GAMM|nr:nickel-dependent hydrogenase large subunit [Lamprobacter modestohalophilus]MBK1617110.1 hypothetical protein [Lamprobacter modestohalophilus]
MSDLAGQLEIRLDQRSGAVAIGSSRPVTAARVFAGKSPAEVVRQLPTLFSLCGTAQAAACTAACEQALGRQPSAAVLARRRALVQAETIKEHLWRLLLDWPKMLECKAEAMGNINANANANANANGSSKSRGNGKGNAGAGANARASTLALPTAASAMPRVMQAFMALRQAQQAVGDPFSLDEQQAERGAAAEIDSSRLLDLVADQALEAAPADWLHAVDRLATLQRWSEQTGTPAAGLVRALVAQGLAGCGANSVLRLPDSPWQQLAWSLASVEADAFIAAPQWRQECAETGPLARVAAQPLIADLLARHGNGLLTRLAALLVDLAQSACRLEVMLSTTVEGASNTARSWVANSATLEPQAEAISNVDPENSRLQDLGRTAMSASFTASGEPKSVLANKVMAGDTGIDVGADVGMNDGTSPDRDPRLGIGTGTGTGVGSAEAARGLLVHRVTMINGRVEQYQILAPTEWNFHPQGVVAQGLTAIARSGAEGAELERLARLYITAVDPCVDYKLYVS